MKRIVVALAVLFAATAASAEAAAPAEIFAKRCAACHGKEGKGDTPMAQKLGAKDISALKASEAEIAEVIANGKGKMTSFKGKMTDEEIKSVAKFVKGGLK
ncbi:cytochrome c [Anaeromyxobacter sp. Fw109-5]|uniref:c-type cytochrome n=1 Tax=Anaeromyxobacter sp. (strain Fw109-5) TaxID=404589 RepID=UPI0000ED7489|nr:cytochrome c [Anaeromyxobacter sp. Fw109-5]ABS26606.1 cytochrome c class I [Anaeromyxobacter sp. Fw109-5]